MANLLTLELLQLQINELNKLLTSQKDEYIPKTRMLELYDLSTSTLRNRVQDGLLTPYKIAHRVYFKKSEIHRILEESVK